MVQLLAFHAISRCFGALVRLWSTVSELSRLDKVLMRSSLIFNKPLSSEATVYIPSLGQSSYNLGHCLKVELRLLPKGLFRKRAGNHASFMVDLILFLMFYHSSSIPSF